MEDDRRDIKQIVLSVLEECSQCHHPHSIDDFRVVGRNGNLWVLTTRCSRCSAQAFVAAVVGDYGVEVADADTEWVEEDEERDEHEADPVTVDDVLDMHEFLESFDGDFRALFSRRR